MEAERLTAVVVFPTPPFWLAMQITLAIIETHGIMEYWFSKSFNSLFHRSIILVFQFMFFIA
jgi:hypothetical protein